jgi:Cell shape-determining protein
LGWSEYFRGRSSSFFSSILFLSKDDDNQDVVLEIGQIKAENTYLRKEMAYFRELLHQQSLVIQQWMDFEKDKEGVSSYERLKNEGQVQLQLVSAKVIYRDPASWSSVLWVDVGENSDPSKGKVVAEDSPVLVDGAVVGVVDLVENECARVRLLTDSSLVPSVRVSRVIQQNLLLKRHVDILREAIVNRTDLLDEEERGSFHNSLHFLSERLVENKKDSY